MDELATALWGSPTFPRVLGILLDQPNREFPFAELVEGVGADRESVHRALRRAMAAGLVGRRRVGNQFLYSANLGSPFINEVSALSAKTYGMQRLLQDVLTEVGRPAVESAFLFGSQAAGTGRPDSDIDLMVIGAATRFDLARILKGVQERLSRHVNALAYPAAEVQRRLNSGDAFFLEVWAGPKMMLVGSEDDLPKLGVNEATWS